MYEQKAALKNISDVDRSSGGACIYRFFCSADYYCILLFLYELEFGPYGFTAVYRSS